MAGRAHDRSGNEHVSSISTAATFKLECAGDGGTASATVTVTTVAQGNDNSGGGGALGWLALAGLALAGAVRVGTGGGRRARPATLGRPGHPPQTHSLIVWRGCARPSPARQERPHLSDL
jgi:hypothetical protein